MTNYEGSLVAERMFVAAMFAVMSLVALMGRHAIHREESLDHDLCGLAFIDVLRESAMDWGATARFLAVAAPMGRHQHHEV